MWSIRHLPVDFNNILGAISGGIDALIQFNVVSVNTRRSGNFDTSAFGRRLSGY